MISGLRQAVGLLLVSIVAGFGANVLREEPLPFSGSLEPPPPAEQGAELPAQSAEEARMRFEEGAIFLDVRPLEEYESLHISGAYSLPVAEFDDRYFDIVAELGADVPMFVYGAGPDSHSVRRVAAKLMDFGHAEVGLAVCGVDRLTTEGIDPAGQLMDRVNRMDDVE